jgi:hypothetical protein
LVTADFQLDGARLSVRDGSCEDMGALMISSSKSGTSAAKAARIIATGCRG